MISWVIIGVKCLRESSPLTKKTIWEKRDSPLDKVSRSNWRSAKCPRQRSMSCPSWAARIQVWSIVWNWMRMRKIQSPGCWVIRVLKGCRIWGILRIRSGILRLMWSRRMPRSLERRKMGDWRFIGQSILSHINIMFLLFTIKECQRRWSSIYSRSKIKIYVILDKCNGFWINANGLIKKYVYAFKKLFKKLSYLQIDSC